MHDEERTPHTVRSHRPDELRRLQAEGIRVQTVVSGRIVHVFDDSDGRTTRAITIDDGLGNRHILPGISVIWESKDVDYERAEEEEPVSVERRALALLLHQIQLGRNSRDPGIDKLIDELEGTKEIG